ncbi:hypothetical protein ASG86_12525 [Arthrobacter sp. Soil764]|nr:hypothetical protein ASG86_12525 [Arthrobacter sp. Soil764]
MGEQKGRANKRGSTAFLPLGLVFLALAVAMVFLGNVAWIAFFTMGITFLVVGLQNRARTGQHRSGDTPGG